MSVITFIKEGILEEERKQCKDCAKFRDWQSDCTYKKDIREGIIIATDTACDDFEPKKGRRGRAGRRSRAKKRKHWKLDLFAPIPTTLKPCGFYPESNTLTESVWLPYTDKQNNVTLRPSIILAEKGKEPEILDFMKQDRIKGVFPSQDLKTLMSVKGVQMLVSHMDIEPQNVDKEIDEAVRKHLHIPDAERILVKRWLEGSFFYDTFDAYPIQNVLGVSESGKSRLCLLNLSLAYHAEPLIDPTEATIFRSKEEDKVSLIIDEAEYLNNPNLYSTLRILLNASYSKDIGYVTRYDEQDGKRVKRRFDLYSPMCISGIGGLEGVTLSRAFRIVMRRVDKDFPKAKPYTYRHLRDMLYVLRTRHAFEVRELYEKTDISNTVTARFEELFKPIFVMTEFFGTNEERETLKTWCKEYQANFRIEALNVALEEQVLTVIANTETKDDWYSLKTLSLSIGVMYSRSLRPKQISNILYRLGITKRRKIHGLTQVYAPKELLEESAQRIGIPLKDLSLSFSSTNSTKSTKSTENKKSWLERL